ncbi:MAG: hypothetical protein N2645_12655 [Clostridia bacterium]|nr:hypothetical protein [Clostridia bacterium]
MAIGQGIAPHETFEIHELLTFKTLCATKSATMSKLVSDSELKSILQDDVSASKDAIRELQSLLQRSTFAAGTDTTGATTTTSTTTTM